MPLSRLGMGLGKQLQFCPVLAFSKGCRHEQVGLSLLRDCFYLAWVYSWGERQKPETRIWEHWERARVWGFAVLEYCSAPRGQHPSQAVVPAWPGECEVQELMQGGNSLGMT